MPNMNGGYSIVDFTGCDLGNLGTVTGLYNRLKSAIETDKPIVLSGIVNGEQAFTPIVAYGGVESATSVFVSFFTITLHVSNADVVTM